MEAESEFAKSRTTKRPNKLRETDSETKGFNKIKKTKHACIVESHDTTRKRWDRLNRKIMKITLHKEGLNSLSHYNLAHQFVPMPPADTKEAVSGPRRDETRRDDALAVGQPDKRFPWIHSKTQGLTNTTLYLWSEGSAHPLILSLPEADNGVSHLPFDLNDLRVLTGCPAHWLSILELLLPSGQTMEEARKVASVAIDLSKELFLKHKESKRQSIFLR